MATMKTSQEVADMYGIDISEQAAKDMATDYYQPAQEAIYAEQEVAFSDFIANSTTVQDQFMSDYLQLGQDILRSQSGISGAAIAAAGQSREELATEIANQELALESTLLNLQNEQAKLEAKMYADAAKIYFNKLGVVNQYREADFQNQIAQETLDLQTKSAKVNAALSVVGMGVDKAIAEAQIASSESIAAMQIQANKEIAAASAGAQSAIAGMQAEAIANYAQTMGNALNDLFGDLDSGSSSSSGGTQGPPPTYVDSDNDGKNDLTEKF